MSSSDLGGATGRVGLVTGGASGIGRAVVLALVRGGARVVIADQDEERGAAVVAEATDLLGATSFVAVDVADPAAPERVVAEAVRLFGRLDLAVNGAGTPGAYGPLSTQTQESWDRTIAVNLTAVFSFVRAEVPAMLASGGGSIVNIASAAGLMGFANLPAYVASKHGVVGLTKSVALELARAGVRVNAVCPGNVRTPMLERFAGGEEALEGMGRVTPMGRLGTPEEVAEAVVWLCSEASSYVTGHAFAVDGGVLAT